MLAKTPLSPLLLDKPWQVFSPLIDPTFISFLNWRSSHTELAERQRVSEPEPQRASESDSGSVRPNPSGSAWQLMQAFIGVSGLLLDGTI